MLFEGVEVAVTVEEQQIALDAPCWDKCDDGPRFSCLYLYQHRGLKKAFRDDAQASLGESTIASSERRMREIRISGATSGDCVAAVGGTHYGVS